MKYTILVFCTLCCTWIATTAQIFSVTNFESQAVGTPFIRSLWQADGFTTDTWDNGLADRTMIDNTTSVSGTKSLRVTYPAGEYGPGPNGTQVPLLFTAQNEAYMSYWVRFSENFSWGTTSEGGKLPGLAGGARCSGCAVCTGTNGFSARLMWRPGGKAVLYLYHLDKVNACGDNLDLVFPGGENVIFQKGVWYHIMERVKINSSPTTYDGEVEVWVNGQHVLLTTGYRFVTNTDKVDALYFSTFHGGSDATWAPTETCYTWFDDVKIGATKADVDYVSCTGPQIGSNKTLCGATSVTLDANVSPTNATFIWLHNGTTIGNSQTIQVSSPGEYVVVYDSLGCVRKDTVSVTNVLAPQLGADRFICSSSFETLHANVEGIGVSYVWKKNSNIIANATSSSLTVKDAGSYSVTVSASGCADASDEVEVTSGLLQVSDASGAVNSPVTLSVQNAGTDYGWYTVSAGGTQVYQGKDYTTTIPATNSYLYVQDNLGYSGIVGKLQPVTGGTYTDNRFDRRMKFEVFRTLTLDSISVYPVATQNVTVRILASDQSTVVSTITYTNLSAGEQRIKIGTQLSPGIYYMDAAGTTDKLSHSYEADTDIHFPYTVDGLISILGSNLAWIDAKPYYLFFYKWRVTAGNYCARTPVLLSNTSSVVPVSQTIQLEAGWNLISTNVHPTDSSIATVFTGLQVQQIKNADVFWKLGQAAELNKLTHIQAGMGYLVLMNTAGSLTISGIPCTSVVQYAPTGWQLIGYPCTGVLPYAPIPISNYFNVTNCEIIKNFDGFWEPGGTANSITNFEQGKGYFLKK
ncbi:MAG TPA: hypothetical protein PK029_00315 [Bacteroidales bacterium]|nr:MAG: hypothetical protein BWY22_00707 [Bacteroidetes bacterium ADurb.Bin217]HPH15585.1 hypothetical protein [Bacteroidales bacterium]